MTDKEKKERLQEIEQLLKELEEKKQKLKEERRNLLCLEENNTQVFDSLSARAYNGLYRLGIRKDTELLSFLEGDVSFMQIYRIPTNYGKQKNPIDRLLTIRSLGEKSANEVIAVCKQHGLIKEEH